MPNVNLIPIERQAQLQQRQHLRRWMVIGAIWGGLVLSACVGAQLAWGVNDAAIAEELSQTDKHTAEMNQKLNDTRRQLAEAETLRQTAMSLSDQPDWSILLAILGGSVGDDLVLREIHLKPDANAVVKQYSLQMIGISKTQESVSQFVLKLQSSGLFDEVKLLRTGREPVLETSAVTFEISCAMREGGK